MKAYLFSIGESTTDVAKWSLERHGLDVVLLHSPHTTFHEKYMEFLEMAKDDDVVIRWDADVVATRGLAEFIDLFTSQEHRWWMTGSGYCYLKHDMVHLSGNIMNNKVISIGREHMHEFAGLSRPETALSRVDELMKPTRRFGAMDMFIGIHGAKQRPKDIERVLWQKEERGQYEGWDHDLIDKLNAI